VPDRAALADWIRLTLVAGVGGESQRALLRKLGPPENIFRATRSDLERVVSAPLAAGLLAQPAQAEIDRTLAWASQTGNHLITLADPEYPRALLETPDPPIMLYGKGRLELLDRPALAVVGSRNPTPQGLANAEAFSRALSESGLTIVSGLALGIDAAAHRGALDRVGSTIAVIGTGADRVYPARNQDLAHRIAQQGLILSEFALGTPALAANFPRRNRLISGLSRGVLVVEAAERSGSLITARLAGEQGREVFAIPGSIHSALSKGCHRLIKDGAKLVESAADVLSEIGQTGAAHAAAGPRPTAAPASAEDAALLAAMGYDPVDLDELTQRTGLTPGALSAMLLALELEGRVAALAGGRFQRLD
jgi:DNA processing protein